MPVSGIVLNCVAASVNDVALRLAEIPCLVPKAVTLSSRVQNKENIEISSIFHAV